MWDAWSLGRASWEPIIAICEVLREVVGTCVHCCNAAAACAEAGTSVARLALHLASFLFFFFSRLSDGTHIHTHARTHYPRPSRLAFLHGWPFLPTTPLSLYAKLQLTTVSTSQHVRLSKKKKKKQNTFFFFTFSFCSLNKYWLFFLFFFYFFFFPCILVQPVYSTRFPDSIVKTRTLFRSCLFFFLCFFGYPLE